MSPLKAHTTGVHFIISFYLFVHTYTHQTFYSFLKNSKCAQLDNFITCLAICLATLHIIHFIKNELDLVIKFQYNIFCIKLFTYHNNNKKPVSQHNSVVDKSLVLYGVILSRFNKVLYDFYWMKNAFDIVWNHLCVAERQSM